MSMYKLCIKGIAIFVKWWYNCITKKGTTNRIIEVLKKYELKIEDEHKLTDIINAMNFDKKRTNDAIKFILLNSIGDAFIKPINNKNIPEFFGI